MTLITATTEEIKHKSNKVNPSFYSIYRKYYFSLPEKIIDVVIHQVDFSNKFDVNLTSEEMTKSSMSFSISSFSKEWDLEEDEYWNKYLV